MTYLRRVAPTPPAAAVPPVSTAGFHRSTLATYNSGTGTAGADNTAQTVKSITLPANALKEVGDRLRIRSYVFATAGAPITATLSLNAVSCADATLTSTAVAVEEAWLHYIDNTHANILDTNGAPGFTALNVAGFTFNAAQTIAVAQTQVVAQHVVVGILIVDVLPKGVT
jgi:hypothetical protein